MKTTRPLNSWAPRTLLCYILLVWKKSHGQATITGGNKRLQDEHTCTGMGGILGSQIPRRFVYSQTFGKSWTKPLWPLALWAQRNPPGVQALGEDGSSGSGTAFLGPGSGRHITVSIQCCSQGSDEMDARGSRSVLPNSAWHGAWCILGVQ